MRGGAIRPCSMGSKREVGGSSEAWTGLLAVLGTLVGSPFQVSVGNREAQYLPTAEGGPAPSMDVCTVSLVLRSPPYHRTQKHVQIWMCLHGKASVFKILFKSPRMGIISGELYLLVGAILNGFMYFPPVIH